MGHSWDPAEPAERSEKADSRSGSYRRQEFEPDTKKAAEKSEWPTTGNY